MSAASAEFERVLRPFASALDRRNRRAAWRGGLARGFRLAPLVGAAVFLLIGGLRLLGVTFATPLLAAALVAAWLFLDAGIRVTYAFMTASSTADAAAACDARFGWPDTLGAAFEFASLGHAHGMRLAAIEDGRARLERLHAVRADLPDAAIDVRWSRGVGAIVLALAAGWVPLAAANGVGREPTSAPRPTGSTADDAPSHHPDSRLAHVATSRPASRPPPSKAAAPEVARQRSAAAPGTTAPAGAAPSAGGKSAAEGTPSTGASEASSSKGGEASAGTGGGGSAAGSAAAAGAQPPPTKRPVTAAAPPPKAPEKGAREDAVGATGGASRNRGRTTPTGGRKETTDRGSPPGDDARSPDEDSQDEREETEQRGGVAPLRRDRPKPPSRELSISGDGPPNDGRGGPTPPKKSRGTAALVLGVTLEDQVRGQPNPGTARTSIGRIPPLPEGDADRERAAARAPSVKPTPQPPHLLAEPWRSLLIRYHERLRQSARPEIPQ